LAKKSLLNQQIRFPKVQLIDQKGENLGTMDTKEAQLKANESGLDLILVAENAKPPVVRIADYGKHQYKQRKKTQKGKHSGEMKEVRLSLNIEEHDINFKTKQAEKFLKKGHPLKISMMLHGRQQAFGDRAQDQIQLFVDKLSTVSIVEQNIKREGKVFFATLKPR